MSELPIETSEDINGGKNISVSPSPRDREAIEFNDPTEYLTCLTPRMLKFVYALIDNHMDVPKAARQAVISKEYAYKLMSDIRVRRAYSAIMANNSFGSVMGYYEILNHATKVVRNDESIYDEILNVKTGKVAKIKPPQKDVFKYLEMLAKHATIIQDKALLQINSTGTQQIIVDISEEDEELVKKHEKRHRKDITDESEYIEV
ncbi:hypothetical protein ABES96_23625 [Bacillus nitratireducens]|uniref:hypothetical protein n=1 Tax=Bacillus nitratireducens TaxID=2026193 RepID=UPI000BF980DD|nr:hypothetical protein CN467_14215 [Bacillus cereus]PFS16470.1 hypothetical protein COK55_06925 [Bacillus cereus]